MKLFGKILLAATILLTLSIIAKGFGVPGSGPIIVIAGAILALMFLIQIIASFTFKPKLLGATGIITSIACFSTTFTVLFAYMFWPGTVFIFAVTFAFFSTALLIITLTRSKTYSEKNKSILNLNLFYPASILYFLMVLYLMTPAETFWNIFSNNNKMTYEEYIESMKRERNKKEPGDQEREDKDTLI